MSILRTVLNSIFRRNATVTEPAYVDSIPPTVDPFAIPDTFHDTSSIGRGTRFALRQEPAGAMGTAPVTTQQARNGREYLMLGTLDEVRNFVDNPPSRSTTIFLTGQLVMLSEADVSNIEHYHRQTDRVVKSIGSITKRTIPFTLKVWLHEEAVALKRQFPRHKFCFALDQYLTYGRSQNTSLYLITGHSGATDTIIHIFTFNNGALTAIAEKMLPSTTHPRFAADYLSLLASFRRNGHSVTVVDPLPIPDGDQYAYLDHVIYDKPISYFIVDQTATPSSFVRHGLSVGVAVASIVAFLGAMAVPYDDYSRATAEFQRIANTIPKDDLAFGSDQLKTMQERRLFLTDTRPQHSSINFLRNVTTTLSSAGVIIRKITLNQVKAQASDPDIAIVIEVKRSASESVFDQGKPILDRLANRLGVDVRLAHNGYQERTTADGRFITYNIEGTFKGATQ